MACLDMGSPRICVAHLSDILRDVAYVTGLKSNINEQTEVDSEMQRADWWWSEGRGGGAGGAGRRGGEVQTGGYRIVTGV